MNYEMERVGGVTFGNEEFQGAVKRYIPRGHTFKAFPIQFNHKNAYHMMLKIKNAPVGNAPKPLDFFLRSQRIFWLREGIT